MEKCLSDLFAETKGGPLVVDGKLTYASYVRIVESGSTFNVRIVSATTEFVQGLRILTDRPVIEVSGQKLKNIMVWADTSPERTEYRVGGRGQKKIHFWNCWRLYRGDISTTMAWMRNAGMQIEEIEGGVRLHCSDGRGDADFTDLVVEITFS